MGVVTIRDQKLAIPAKAGHRRGGLQTRPRYIVHAEAGGRLPPLRAERTDNGAATICPPPAFPFLFFAPSWLRVNNHSGFTLLEILIVLVVLAIAAGLITLTVGNDERGTLQREAQRLTGALEYAADRARFRHEIVGVSALPGNHGWRFWSIPEDAGKGVSWRVVTDDAPLTAHRLSGEFTLRPLYYAGQPLAADAIVPLLPSGRFEPYALELRGADWSLRLNSDPLGRISAILPEASEAAR